MVSTSIFKVIQILLYAQPLCVVLSRKYVVADFGNALGNQFRQGRKLFYIRTADFNKIFNIVEFLLYFRLIDGSFFFITFVLDIQHGAVLTIIIVVGIGHGEPILIANVGFFAIRRIIVRGYVEVQRLATAKKLLNLTVFALPSKIPNVKRKSRESRQARLSGQQVRNGIRNHIQTRCSILFFWQFGIDIQQFEPNGGFPNFSIAYQYHFGFVQVFHFCVYLVQ